VTPGFWEAARYWLQLGLVSFGGPAGQIAMMQSELVDRRKWIGQREFLQALNFCMLLPGPEAQQLATYIGWRTHGVWGGIVSGGLFVLPGAILMMGLAWLAAAHGDAGVVGAIFDGVKPVVVAVVVFAVWRIGVKSFTHWAPVALAAFAFISLRFLGLPFPVVVFGAGLVGWIAARRGFDGFAAGGHGAPSTAAPADPSPSWRTVLKPLLAFVILWSLPVGLLLALAGTQPYLDVVRLFTVAAFVTFGGAYAVLPYIAEAAVAAQWLTPAEMVNGLALAESTPGPLILVNGYVGFFAGWAQGNLGAALLAGGAAVYLTFLPSFLFIFAGGPFLQRLSGNKLAQGALAAITAAVVGVILNLALFFAIAVWQETPAEARWISVGLCLFALGAQVLKKLSTPWLVVIGAGVGVARHLLG
jgi:chromate transporter